MNPFTLRVIEVIKNIPPGRVLSYGLIAQIAGNPKGARTVAWILKSKTEKEKLPWHRVVNGKGFISVKSPLLYDMQKELLISEGIIFINEQIDLDKYLHI